MMTVFEGIVQGLADIVKSIGGVDAGTIIVVALVIVAIVYAANKTGVINLKGKM